MARLVLLPIFILAVALTGCAGVQRAYDVDRCRQGDPVACLRVGQSVLQEGERTVTEGRDAARGVAYGVTSGSVRAVVVNDVGYQLVCVTSVAYGWSEPLRSADRLTFFLPEEFISGEAEDVLLVQQGRLAGNRCVPVAGPTFQVVLDEQFRSRYVWDRFERSTHTGRPILLPVSGMDQTNGRTFDYEVDNSSARQVVPARRSRAISHTGTTAAQRACTVLPEPRRSACLQAN